MSSVKTFGGSRVSGKSDMQSRIYIEDYVKSYITRLSQDPNAGGSIEMLFGKYGAAENGSVEIDINGAATLCKGNKRWKSHELERSIATLNMEFFPELEPVGWFLVPAKGEARDYGALYDMHEELMGEKGGVMLLPGECDSSPEIFEYEEDGFKKLKDLVVYYDKNSEMQEYLLAKGVGRRRDFYEMRATVREQLEKMGGLRVSPMFGLAFVGVLVIILAGLLIVFKTQYYTDMESTWEYLKEFIRYYSSR